VLLLLLKISVISPTIFKNNVFSLRNVAFLKNHLNPSPANFLNDKKLGILYFLPDFV